MSGQNSHRAKILMKFWFCTRETCREKCLATNIELHFLRNEDKQVTPNMFHCKFQAWLHEEDSRRSSTNPVLKAIRLASLRLRQEHYHHHQNHNRPTLFSGKSLWASNTDLLDNSKLEIKEVSMNQSFHQTVLIRHLPWQDLSEWQAAKFWSVSGCSMVPHMSKTTAAPQEGSKNKVETE